MTISSFDLNTDELIVHNITATTVTGAFNLAPGLWHIVGYVVVDDGVANPRTDAKSAVVVALDGTTVVTDQCDTRRGVYAQVYISGSSRTVQFDYGTVAVPTGADQALQFTVPAGLTVVCQARRVPTAIPFTKSIWTGNSQDAYAYTISKSDNAAITSPDTMFTGEVPSGVYSVHVRFAAKEGSDINIDFGSISQTLQGPPDGLGSTHHMIEYRNNVLVNPGTSGIIKTVSDTSNVKDFTMTLIWLGEYI